MARLLNIFFSAVLNDDEQRLFNQYAKSKGKTVAILLKQALFNGIEDYLDYQDGINNLPNSPDEIISREKVLAEFN